MLNLEYLTSGQLAHEAIGNLIYLIYWLFLWVLTHQLNLKTNFFQIFSFHNIPINTYIKLFKINF